MKRNQRSCNLCARLISISNYNKHVNSHNKKLITKNKTPRVAWNKGLTKNTHPSITKMVDTKKLKYPNGFWTNKKHSDETKKKISKIRKNYIEKTGEIPFLLNHSSKKSWLEKTLDNALREENIDGYLCEYVTGRYSYDFAWPLIKLNVEVDGQFHNNEKVKIKDQERDIWTKNNGWHILRFSWNDIRYNLHYVLEQIKFKINILNLGG